MSYIKTQLRDSGLHSVNDLSQAMASHDDDEWLVVCTGIDVDSAIAT